MVAQFFSGVSPAQAIGGTPDNTWMTNGTVFAQALSEDKKTIYIGGRFTALRDRAGNQTPVTNLAAIDVATGEPVRTWKPRATGDGAIVQSIAAKNGRLFVGGNFTAVNDTPRSNIAEVDPADGSLKPFAPQITYEGNTLPPTVNTMLVDGYKLYVGGDFNRADGKTRPKLAAFGLATGALDNAWKPKATRVVKDMEFDATGETIIAVGRFASVTGSDGATASRDTVARFYTNTGNVHPWAIPAGVIGETEQTGWDVLVTPTRIYAGFGDKGPNYAAAFRLDDGDVGSQIWRYGTVGDVQTLGLSPDGKRLYFGGHFGVNHLEQQVCGNQFLSGLASLNPDTGQLFCDWLPQLRPTDNNGNGPRAEMVVTNASHLWVGGGFNDGVSGVPQRNLARFSLVEASKVDTPPKVTSTTPTGKKVSSKANATATFSEAMNEASVEARGTFTLKKKGSARAISATVTYDPTSKKATLNPTRKLRPGATYTATVATAAKDSAGNALDQNPATAGDQPESWRFKVR